MAELCLLTVHAHPDDESSKGAGSVARYHAEGVRTVLVTCTGGEAGDILNPAMERPEIRENLARVRRQELDRAAEIIGYDEVVLLGYRDSGMPDTEANTDPRSFAQAPLDEAVERLVAIIRSERPQVVVTYPRDQSGYPHPDHLRVHEITMVAWDAAGDPERFKRAGEPWTPLKLYSVTWSPHRVLRLHEAFVAHGMESPFSEERLTRARESVTRGTGAVTRVDIRGYGTVASDALRAHATQVDPTSPHWFGLPAEEAERAWPYDEYALLEDRTKMGGEEPDQAAPDHAATDHAATDQTPPGLPGPDQAAEDDLFAGVRQPVHP